MTLSKREPFCCSALLQTRWITRQQLLAAFLRNLSQFLMTNGLQFSNILGFVSCSHLQITPEIFYGVQVRWLWCHCRLVHDFFCNQVLVEFEVCLGSLSCWKVQASASSLTAWRFLLGLPDTSMNPSCLPHAVGFQCHRMQTWHLTNLSVKLLWYNLYCKKHYINKCDLTW